MSTPAKKPATKQPAVPTSVTAVLDAYQGALNEAREAFQDQMKQEQADWQEKLNREKEQDTYEYEKEKRDRNDQLDEELAERTKEVTAREEAVSTREEVAYKAEAEMAELRKLKEDLPGKLGAEFAKGEKAGAIKAAADAAVDARIKEAEYNSNVAILRNDIASLRSENEKKDETIASLLEQLNSANSRVETIATSAVTAAGQSKVNIQTGAQGK